MIVQQFLRWVRTAPPGERADAASAVARAFLHSPLDPLDRKAAEVAMTVLLDDPAPQVRLALAHAIAPSFKAPLPIIHALARDAGDIASIVLAQSPLLQDGDLIDALTEGDWRAQVAVACRTELSDSVTMAICELGGVDACLALIQNSDAMLPCGAFLHILTRHGEDSVIRSAILDRPDLPLEIRQATIVRLSSALAGMVAERGWLSGDRAQRVAAEARDRVTLELALNARGHGLRDLVAHLRNSGQITVSLLLRALLSGDLLFFEETLADLSGLPLERVSALIASRHVSSFAALHQKAGLPSQSLPAFRAALEVLHSHGFAQNAAGGARLSRLMTERVLTTVSALDDAAIDPLLALLRRFVAEAARDEARAIADDVVNDALLAA
jgi:uncharacterized protein (DUF2336 family)